MAMDPVHTLQIPIALRHCSLQEVFDATVAIVVCNSDVLDPFNDRDEPIIDDALL
jgi:hypothetical protein